MSMPRETAVDKEILRGFRRFFKLPMKEQEQLLRKAEEEAERINADFDRKIRLDWKDLWIRITI